MKATLLKLAFATAWGCMAVGMYNLATMTLPIRVADTLRWPARALADLAEMLGASSSDGASDSWGSDLASLLVALVGTAVGLAILRILSGNPARLRLYTAVTVSAAPWLTNAQAVVIGVATRRSVAEGIFVVVGTILLLGLTAVAFRAAGSGSGSKALVLGTTVGLFSGAFLYWLNSPASLMLQWMSVLLIVPFFTLTVIGNGSSRRFEGVE